MHLFDLSVINIFFNLLVVAVSVILLWKGADYLVDSASRLAARLGVSELVIGLTIVAMGTSAPEFVVSLTAALQGKPDISAGNIVGSNIFNLGFILGAVAIVQSVKATRELVYRDCIVMLIITVMLFLFIRDQYLSRIEGVAMMSLLAAYLVFLFVRKEGPKDEPVHAEKAGPRDLLILFLSIAAVVMGGELLVASSSYLASKAGISQWAIGVTIVAAGTSAPEMATSLAAVIKGKHGISAGNLIGSDIFNILGVLGFTIIVNPLKVDAASYFSILMLNGMIIVVIIFFRTGWQISRMEGVLLLLIAVIRWVFDLVKI